MAISDIIDAARDVLGDPSAQRWSDARLIRLLNYGIRDLVVKTNLLNVVVFMELDTSLTTYNMSAKLLDIDRVQYKGVNVPMLTHSQMDSKDLDWQSTVGADDVEAIVYDKLDRGMLRIYPALTDVTNQDIVNSNYGILIEINIATEPIYVDEADLPNVNKYLAVYGTANPDKITALTDVRPVDEQWDSTLAHYIAGHALRSDMDDQNRAFGNEEIALYEQDIALIKSKESSSNNSTSDLTTNYRKL